MSIPSYTTCWDRVVPGDVILYFYVNSDGFFLQKGVFPCLWPKCWSLGAGAGSPPWGGEDAALSCPQGAAAHQAHMDGPGQGTVVWGRPSAWPVGRVRSPAGGGVCFSWWIRAFLEGRAFPACR